MEIVVETHGGWESTAEGLSAFLENTSTRLVVDFGNITDGAGAALILQGGIGERIAYFHLRSLPGAASSDTILDVREAHAMSTYPGHSFLWEPKGLESPEALAVWRKFNTDLESAEG
jgi:hypothetical protein